MLNVMHVYNLYLLYRFLTCYKYNTIDLSCVKLYRIGCHDIVLYLGITYIIYQCYPDIVTL